MSVHSIGYKLKLMIFIEAFGSCIDQVVVEPPCCSVRGMI